MDLVTNDLLNSRLKDDFSGLKSRKIKIIQKLRCEVPGLKILIVHQSQVERNGGFDANLDCLPPEPLEARRSRVY